MVTDGVQVPQGFDAFGPWLNETLNLLKAQFQKWLLISLIYIGIQALVGTMLHALAPILSFVVSALLLPGMIRAGLKQIRGQSFGVDDLFSGTGMFLDSLVVIIALVIGSVACGIGVFVTHAMFYLALPLLVDKTFNMGKALETSFDITKHNFLFFLIYSLVITLLAVVGIVIFGIGIIVTFPISVLGMVVAYEHTVNPASSLPQTPGESPEP